MKRILTVLLTLLIVFALVGCNSKQDTPIVEEPKQQEAIEPAKEEPKVVGGFVDAEDPTITDELKDIFDEGLSAMLGAKYEPVKLLATQVVNGINYKFLATGTKTSNPITVGTYNVIINKATDGSISLVDIELVEEKQEEVETQDLSNVSFWVVFYDQDGNELQREALKYGTVPTYKADLPEGFEKWTYKKSGKDVTKFKAITGNIYYQAVCHEVKHGSIPAPEPIDIEKLPLYYFVYSGSSWTSRIFIYNTSSDSFEQDGDIHDIDNPGVAEGFYHKIGDQYILCEENSNNKPHDKERSEPTPP